MFKRSNKMTDAEKAELKAEILKATPAVPKAVKKKKSALSDKAIAVQKVLGASGLDFNTSRKKTLQELMEIVLGEKLSGSSHITDAPRLKDDSLKKFMVIVPEESSNSHRYPLGKPCLVVADYVDYCMDNKGTLQDHIAPKDCRVASLDEIDEFLDELQKNADALTIVKVLENSY